MHCNGRGDDNDIHSVIALLSRCPRAARASVAVEVDGGGSLQRCRTTDADGRTGGRAGGRMTRSEKRHRPVLWTVAAEGGQTETFRQKYTCPPVRWFCHMQCVSHYVWHG